MSEGQEDVEDSRRKYKTPYSEKKHIPTIQHYREEKARRRGDSATEGHGKEEEEDDGTPSKTQAAIQTYNKIRHGFTGDDGGQGQGPPEYPTVNQNEAPDGQQDGAHDQHDGVSEEPHEDWQAKGKEDEDAGEEAEENKVDPQEADPEDASSPVQDTSEVTATNDPKQRRKEVKKGRDNRAEREVTDPVTHLRITIHDFTGKDLKRVPANEPTTGTTSETATGPTGKGKDEKQLSEEGAEAEGVHEGMERLFPPPDWENAKNELARIYSLASTAGMLVVFAAMLGSYPLQELFGIPHNIKNVWLRRTYKVVYPIIAIGLGWVANTAVKGWAAYKMKDVWETEVWEAERRQGKKFADSQTPESTQWLNSLVASVWPLINPDLFTSLADMLEDVMQASLPKMVRMVSVEDIGQGSEALRILGVRWLPTGAAAKSVTAEGDLKKPDDGQKSDRTVPGEGEMDNTENDDKDKGQDEGQENRDERQADEQEDENVAEGMEAEEGDFVNMEVAFAYRARPANGTGMKSRAKNAHMYLGFYLPANVKLRKLLSLIFS